MASTPVDPLRLIIVAALLVAASFHLLLIGEHAQESSLLAIGFLGSGVLQVGLASLLLAHPNQRLCYAVITLNLILLLLYVVHVLIGLPVVVTPTGLALGPRDDVDLAGALTKAAEILSAALALYLARSGRAQRR